MASGWRRAVFRLGAAAGIAGPAAFTGAWIASSLRQTRHGPGGLQLSGLAAPDARDPAIMLAGFLVAGGRVDAQTWTTWVTGITDAHKADGALLLLILQKGTEPAVIGASRSAWLYAADPDNAR